MPATYIETRLTLNPEYNEILMAELAEIGYESFVESNDGLSAYIPETDFDLEALQQLVERYQALTEISLEYEQLETKNWNEEWERNYQPIEVAGKIRVRASYHTPDPSFEYDIVIDPKMSFGTGHHETTTLVMEQQLSLDQREKSVLDVGSGTGILAILAEKLGATRLTAFDIEEWAYLNAVENAEMNGCTHIHVFQGTIADCPPDTYDIVLANINRNILLQEIPTYVSFLAPGGTLMVSGFYEFDIADIVQKAQEADLRLVTQKTLNQWAVLRFEKP
ncbi:50S ribosomal protein L11 methyltransferase [Runella slithyformis]|uniref:Ribosomal protein L11 methyltransferase n=1 Tax=Runella slithyformis (strain ATCC 29530 / DSM 19594 / LMG 11500 / NCIMB 11436 / LSU 4) TaxID=761193 RepID=A0A7U4E4L1_RUNSL|nr:50S ribosomal protein L11 methyltransferase [Runella slithyformis]AEI47394.1 Ribosomal protein L11 methyltransferase [Runella slithyformis DSM 19594]